MARPEVEEVLWASYVPLRAPARVGKVHLRNPGSARTLCGLIVGLPNKRFDVRASDPRCTRCEKRRLS